MTHIRRLRITLPARMAGIAPSAAREIAERMVDASYTGDGQTTLSDGARVILGDHGQSPAQIGLSAAQSAAQSATRKGGLS